MPLIEITKDNEKQYGGKCVVLQSHIHNKQEVNKGDVVEKYGMEYFEAKKCRLVRDYNPALDEDEKRETKNEKQEISVVINDSESSDVSRLSSIDDKKLRPKKRTKKTKE